MATAAVPPQGASSAFAKPNINKSTNFAGFAPNLNITVNSSKGVSATPTGWAAEGGRSEVGLPMPEFDSPASIRNYCNALRSVGIGLAFEVEMAAEILEGVLKTVPDPQHRPGGSRLRARRSSRKLKKAAEGLKAAAVGAASCYAAFQQDYMEEINRHRHQARKPKQPRINWREQ